MFWRIAGFNLEKILNLGCKANPFFFNPNFILVFKMEILLLESIIANSIKVFQIVVKSRMIDFLESSNTNQLSMDSVATLIAYYHFFTQTTLIKFWKRVQTHWHYISWLEYIIYLYCKMISEQISWPSQIYLDTFPSTIIISWNTTKPDVKMA